MKKEDKEISNRLNELTAENLEITMKLIQDEKPDEELSKKLHENNKMIQEIVNNYELK